MTELEEIEWGEAMELFMSDQAAEATAVDRAITAAGCSAWKTYWDAPLGRNWHEGMATVWLAMKSAHDALVDVKAEPRCSHCGAVWERSIFDVCPVCVRPDPSLQNAPSQKLQARRAAHPGWVPGRTRGHHDR